MNRSSEFAFFMKFIVAEQYIYFGRFERRSLDEMVNYLLIHWDLMKAVSPPLYSIDSLGISIAI